MYHIRESRREMDEAAIVIRRAREADRGALRRVAQRDTAPVPEGELLVAVDRGELRAAISVESLEAIADPFHRTAELVRMLSLRVAQPRGRSARGRFGRLRRVRGAGSAPQPPGTLRPAR
jgi:hypothetical protein